MPVMVVVFVSLLGAKLVQISCNLRLDDQLDFYELLTVSPILSPEQDLTPGINSPLRHVALNNKLSSSGTPNTSNSAFDLIFYRGKSA